MHLFAFVTLNYAHIAFAEKEIGRIGGSLARKEWGTGVGGSRVGGGYVSFHWLPIHQSSVYRCGG